VYHQISVYNNSFTIFSVGNPGHRFIVLIRDQRRRYCLHSPQPNRQETKSSSEARECSSWCLGRWEGESEQEAHADEINDGAHLQRLVASEVRVGDGAYNHREHVDDDIEGVVDASPRGLTETQHAADLIAGAVLDVVIPRHLRGPVGEALGGGNGGQDPYAQGDVIAETPEGSEFFVGRGSSGVSGGVVFVSGRAGALALLAVSVGIVSGTPQRQRTTSLFGAVTSRNVLYDGPRMERSTRCLRSIPHNKADERCTLVRQRGRNSVW
jgi:hypothetical protein